MLFDRTWRADVFWFTVSGPGVQCLFGMAARAGIRLRGIHCVGDGYRARAQGRDKARLEALALQNGWQLCLGRRRGPGRWLEHALRRPGLPAGMVLFAVLVRALSGFVWAMDMGPLEPAQQQQLRALLAQNGVCEGTHLTQPLLHKAQQTLDLHNDWFGWLSLNFTGGCLFVESTPLQRQPVAEGPQDTALYAKADGEVLAVKVNSGFAAVQPGQYVAQGQLLAAAVRLDRDGAPVTQGASGQILARVERSYSASQPLQGEYDVLTGRAQAELALYVMGQRIPLQPPQTEGPPDALAQAQWIPLRFGALALPACLYSVCAWERQPRLLYYSEAAATALARRACRLQLAAEFPDAAVEQALYESHRDGDAIRCEAIYHFQADIAMAAPAQGEAAP